MPRILKIILVVSVAMLVLLTTCSNPVLPGSTARTSFAPVVAYRTPVTATPTAPVPTASLRITLEPRPEPSMVVSPVLPSRTALPPSATPSPPVPSATPSAVPISPLLATAVSQIDAHMHALTELKLFSGAVLVARQGTVLLAKGYGMADYDQGQANNSQTQFRLASVTKQFTAMAILILHARGDLNIHDSICLYLSDCPAAWQSVTIRHLLSHTSGIANYTDFAAFAALETQPATPDQLIGLFRDLPLTFAPGTAYHYGNSGYVLLGRIIEQVSGQSYGDFLQAAIFAPLQMDHSGYAGSASDTISLAHSYADVGTPAKAVDLSTLYAAGGLYSTVEDLYRWDQALATDQFIPADLRAEMFTPVAGSYGYGWKIGDQGGRRVLAHAGSLSGCSTYIARYPDAAVTVIVLSNLENVAAGDISAYLAELVFAAGG